MITRPYVQEADASLLRVKPVSFDLAQNAAVYALVTATDGDVWVEVEQAYVKEAGAGMTSIIIQTDHTTPKTIVNTLAQAGITLDLVCTLVTSKFILPSGKKINGTITGTNGTDGEIILVLKWSPVTAGAYLA